MSFFPFGQQSAASQPPINYDLVIQKQFPRIALEPTESGGVYQEMVEVNGDFWIVTNATYDTNLLGFYQKGACDPSQPAYAWSYNHGGDAVRYAADATGSTTVPVVWTATFETDPQKTKVEPLALNASEQNAFRVECEMDATSSTIMHALSVNVTNTAASVGSALEILQTNDVTKWLVDLDGRLRIGIVPSAQLDPPPYFSLTAGVGIGTISAPPAAIIGLSHGDYVDLHNAQTIDGIKKIANLVPLIFGTNKYATIMGGTNGDLYAISGAEIIDTSPLTALAKATSSVIVQSEAAGSGIVYAIYIDTGLTIGNSFTPTLVYSINSGGNINVVGDETIGGNLTVNAGLNVSGQTNLVNTHITGFLSLAVQARESLETYFVGQNGMLVSLTSGDNIALDGRHFITKITSDAGTISVTTSGAYDQVVNLETGKGIGISLAKGEQADPGAINSTGVHLSLPTLGEGTWFVEAICHGFGFLTDPATISMNGTGGMSTDTIAAVNEQTRTLYAFASMTKGQTPGVLLKSGGTGQVAVHAGSTGIALTIKAIRTA